MRIRLGTTNTAEQARLRFEAKLGSRRISQLLGIPRTTAFVAIRRLEKKTKRHRMNDFAVSIKFLMTIVGFILPLGLIGQIKPLTMKMVLLAIEADQKDQMPYGKFSRQLLRKSRSR